MTLWLLLLILLSVECGVLATLAVGSWILDLEERDS